MDRHLESGDIFPQSGALSKLAGALLVGKHIINWNVATRSQLSITWDRDWHQTEVLNPGSSMLNDAFHYGKQDFKVRLEETVFHVPSSS